MKRLSQAMEALKGQKRSMREVSAGGSRSLSLVGASAVFSLVGVKPNGYSPYAICNLTPLLTTPEGLKEGEGNLLSKACHING